MPISSKSTKPRRTSQRASLHLEAGGPAAGQRDIPYWRCQLVLPGHTLTVTRANANFQWAESQQARTEYARAVRRDNSHSRVLSANLRCGQNAGVLSAVGRRRGDRAREQRVEGRHPRIPLPLRCLRCSQSDSRPCFFSGSGTAFVCRRVVATEHKHCSLSLNPGFGMKPL